MHKQIKSDHGEASYHTGTERLSEITALPYGWNGYGAGPFSQELIQKCERIVRRLSHQPQIFPTGRQSIQFEYEKDDKSYLEFEIFVDKTVCLRVPERIYGEAEEWTLLDSEDAQIEGIVDEFFGEE